MTKQPKRIQVKETERYWGDFEGTLENIISQLQSELDKGWEGIQTDYEPYEYCTYYYLYKHRPETDKEYEKRMKELEKQKEKNSKQKKNDAKSMNVSKRSLEMINYTPINLQNYIGKEVTAFLRNGKKLVDRIIYDNRFPNYPYKFGLRCYTKDGRTLIGNNCPSDIMFLWVEEKEDKELEEKLQRATEKVMKSNEQTLPEMIKVNGVKYQRVEEPEENEWKNVALKFGEKLASIGPCGYYGYTPDEWFEWAVNTYEKLADDWLILLNKEKQVKKLQKKDWKIGVKTNWEPKPQTEKQVEEGLKEAFREAVKQGVVSSNTTPNSLYDVIADWWDEIFTNGNPSGQNIESLVDSIKEWLPDAVDDAQDDWDDGYNAYYDTVMENLK